MPDHAWTTDHIGDLTGRTAVVTGANSGLGLVTARELLRHGARVVLACRETAKGDAALRWIETETREAGGAGKGEVRALDLADLASVRAFVDGLTDGPQAFDRLDLLVNNAGIMAVPRRDSADGFELQLATNFLGPFALTGLLLPLLRGGRIADGPARVVTLSSLIHLFGRVNRDDLMSTRSYRPFVAYGQSKLADLLFALELQRRVDAAGTPLASLAAHPGVASTNLVEVGPRMAGRARLAAVEGAVTRLTAQSAEQGALPSLRAATDPAARGGEYYGPRWGVRGYPVLAPVRPRVVKDDDAAWLWDRAVELTGVDPV